MADVFVSYSKKDKAHARLIVNALKMDGLEVWWDEGIQTGADWRQSIKRQLEASRVIVALWSTSSVESAWVLEEAEFARARTALCPAFIEDVTAPLGFGGVQASNLVGWRGDRKDPAWTYFSQCVSSFVDGGSKPIGAPPAPKRRLLPQIYATLTAAAAAVAIISFMDATGVVDVLPGGVTPATAQEMQAFEQARALGCTGLRNFVVENPDSALTNRARALLDARRSVERTQLTPFEQIIPVTGASTLADGASQEQACSAAQRSTRSNAERLCGLQAGAGQTSRIETRLLSQDCSCDNLGVSDRPLWRCSIDETAACSGERAILTTSEVC